MSATPRRLDGGRGEAAPAGSPCAGAEGDPSCSSIATAWRTSAGRSPSLILQASIHPRAETIRRRAAAAVRCTAAAVRCAARCRLRRRSRRRRSRCSSSRRMSSRRSPSAACRLRRRRRCTRASDIKNAALLFCIVRSAIVSAACPIGVRSGVRARFSALRVSHPRGAAPGAMSGRAPYLGSGVLVLQVKLPARGPARRVEASAGYSQFRRAAHDHARGASPSLRRDGLDEAGRRSRVDARILCPHGAAHLIELDRDPAPHGSSSDDAILADLQQVLRRNVVGGASSCRTQAASARARPSSGMGSNSPPNR